MRERRGQLSRHHYPIGGRLRRGELIAFRVRAVDFAKSTIRVEGSYSGGELSTPKSGKPRAVPMAREVATAIAKLLTGRGDPGPDELVFPGAGGGYLDDSALRRRYCAAQKRAGRASTPAASRCRPG